MTLDPGRVVVTAGSSAGFILAFTSLFDQGDRVAIGDPGYPSYRNILRALDLVPVGIPTGPEDRFQPAPGDLGRIWRGCWWRARPIRRGRCWRARNSRR